MPAELRERIAASGGRQPALHPRDAGDRRRRPRRARGAAHAARAARARLDRLDPASAACSSAARSRARSSTAAPCKRSPRRAAGRRHGLAALVRQGADPPGPARSCPARTRSASSTSSSATPPTTRPPKTTPRRPPRAVRRLARTASASRVTEYEEILGHHLEQAYRYRAELGRRRRRDPRARRACSRRLAAAGLPRPRPRRPRRSGEPPRPRRRSSPAREPRADRGRARLVEPLAALMRVAEAETLLDQAARAAELLGDERLIARVNVEKAWLVVHATAEQWSESRCSRQVEEAIAVFERLGDDVALARALEVVTHVHLYYGRLSEVAAASERGYRHAERAQHVKEQGKHRLGREVADQWGPTPFDRIDELLEEDLAWARRTGSLGVEACATVQARRGARVARGSGGRKRARRPRDVRLRRARSANLGLRGARLLDLGADGRSRRRRGRGSARPTTCSPRRASAACSRRSRRSSPSASTGRDATTRPTTCSRRPPSWAQTTTSSPRCACGRAGRSSSARRGELDEAEAVAREAVALAAEAEFVDLRGDSLLALAEVLRLAGRKGEAAEAMRQALALWEAKGNVVYAGATRALLAEL